MRRSTEKGKTGMINNVHEVQARNRRNDRASTKSDGKNGPKLPGLRPRITSRPEGQRFVNIGVSG